MPTKSELDIKKFIEVAKKYNLRHTNSTSLKGPSDECWFGISAELEHLITAKYAYTIVKMNRYGVADILFVDEVQHITTIDEKENFSDNFSETSKNDDILNFNITLSTAEWKNIYDNQPQMYKRSDGKNDIRQFYTLKPYNWTSVIHEHFFEQTKLPCSMVYKYAKIYLDGHIFLKINGKCSSCYSSLKGILNNCPIDGSRVIINCTMTGNYSNCMSHKKRRVIGEKKQQYINKLNSQNLSAAYIKRDEAKTIMEYGDKEPSHIPSLNALRLIKYKSLMKEYPNENSLLSISLLKGTPPYNTIIHGIGYDKFFMYYWTSSEINNYRNYFKITSVPTVSIDATGSVVKKFKLLSGRMTHNIFLYQIAVNDSKNGNQFAVAHMLTEKHDNNIISYWLSEWKNTVKNSPKLIITDQSLALMHAITKSFTQFSNLNVYLLNCSKLLMKEPGADIPNCMIRNDFCHIMHLVSSWPELKNSTYRIKNFYMRAIGLLVISTSIEEIKKILELIFTVALSETDGQNNNKIPTDCENAKKILKQKIATHSIDIDIEIKNELNLEEENDETMDDLSVFDELNRIYISCKENSKLSSNTTGDHDNMQYSPTLAKKILNFCKLIPCWSAVMVPIFGYGNITESSSSSESLFKDLKSIIFKHKTLPLRLEDFFITHVNSNIGLMNLIASNNIKEQVVKNEDKKLQAKIIEQTNEEINDDIIENWKGLGQVKKYKKKSTYIDKDPTVLHYNDYSRTKSSVIGILRNGSISELKSIRIGEENISIINTCAFDSLTQIWFCAYADSNAYGTYVEENSKNTFFKLVYNALRDGINVQTYRKRASLLNQIFKDKSFNIQPNGTLVLDSACTAQFMLKQILNDYPSITATIKCPNCSYTIIREELCITVNLPTDDLNFLKDIMTNYCLSNSNCKNCNCNMKQNLKFNAHLVIEPVVPLSEHRKIKRNLDLSIQLKDIPINILVQNNTFYLRGLINFIPPKIVTINSIGHFIAYCYREINNTWEKYDDFQTKVKVVRPTTDAQYCQFLIYTK